MVALSFDDGPHPTFTLEVLEILHRHDAKATFFLIGERSVRHPEVVAPHDTMHPAVRYITWLIEKNLVPGAIVILHDGISDPTRSIRLSRTFLLWDARGDCASSRSVL